MKKGLFLIIGFFCVCVIHAIALSVCTKGKNHEELEVEFFKAVKRGDLETVKLLTQKKGVSANIIDLNERRPIYYAIENGYLDIVSYLIEECGVNEHEVNFFYGRGLIHSACQAGKLKVVKYLSEKRNVDVNVLDASINWKPIHYAVASGNVSVVRYLIEKKGVSLNERNLNGHTPIEIAFFFEKLAVLVCLTEKGALISDELIQNSVGNVDIKIKHYLEDKKEQRKFLLGDKIVDKIELYFTHKNLNVPKFLLYQ